MSNILKYIIFLFFIISATNLSAEDVKFSVSAPNVVKAGERFRLEYTMNAKPDNFNPPAISGFRLLSGPSTSSSSNVQIINGNVERSYTYSLTYVLQAQKEGKHTIPPAVIKVKGKNYQSNKLTIEVVKGKSSGSTGGKQSASRQADVSGGNLFVRVIVNKKEVYKQEHIALSIKLYSKVNLAGFERVEFPDFNGFYQQEIETPQQLSLSRENVNGEIYNTGIMKKYLLFPQQTGKIEIGPVEMECIVRKAAQGGRSGSVFDQFFGRSYQNVKVPVSSKPVTINVKELPAKAPGSFKGAVGNFNMQLNMEKDKLQANEAFYVTVNVSGNGNIRLLEGPDIKFPPDFEVYDPEVNVNVKNTMAGSSGRKTFKYLVIPRHAGSYRIPPAAFTYFNPATADYKTISSKEFNIQVEKGEDDAIGTAAVSGFSKEDVKYLGKDIRYINKGSVNWKKKGHFLLNSGWFYAGYAFSFVLLLMVIIIRRKKIKDNANVELVKNRKANKLAKKRLRTAHKYLKQDNKEVFYEEILKGMWGYLGDKLTIPVANLTTDSAVSMLKKYNIGQELIDELNAVVNECEFARYAPTDELPQMDNIYTRAAKVIAELERNLK
jgi:hypothetical protein